ncbi:MAG TPA: hypothetical protein VHC20_03780 [Candidatus Paceibacterota bacterium]|nr:hypothetical protein [Candidatus Paceibacterota bacterium]
MAYTQEGLVALMKQGKAPGETHAPKHIETFISNVFLFDDRVYKFYKNDNQTFNESFQDFSSKDARFRFTEKDFAWNHASTPSVYTELIGVRAQEDGVVFVPREEAEELVITMNRVDTHDILFEKLLRGAITRDDAFAIGKGLGESLQKVRTPLPGGLNYDEIFQDRIDDARAWMRVMEHRIPSAEIDTYCAYMTDFREQHRALFTGELTAALAYGGDIHSHNALYTGGTLYLMDTYSPKEAWLIEYHGTPVYRLAADMWVLSGEREFFDACIAGYEESSGLTVNRALDDLYVVYALTIAAPYHYMLEQNDATKKDAADRIHTFLREHFSALIKT